MEKIVLPGKYFRFRATITKDHLPVILSGTFMSALLGGF
jgi:hypothetical protein